MNAQAQKEDSNSESIALYYLTQALTWDFMEPYVAYYNAGTSLAKADKPEQAEILLEKSLSIVDNDTNECYVRNNLAAVQEQLGDYYMIADMASTAESYYKKAVTTIAESPGVCFPPPPPSGGGEGGESGEDGGESNPLTPESDPKGDPENGQKMEDTKERSEQKESDAQEAQGDSGNGKEKVEQEMDQSKGEMDSQEDMENQKNNQSGNQVDKPW